MVSKSSSTCFFLALFLEEGFGFSALTADTTADLNRINFSFFKLQLLLKLIFASLVSAVVGMVSGVTENLTIGAVVRAMVWRLRTTLATCPEAESPRIFRTC